MKRRCFLAFVFVLIWFSAAAAAGQNGAGNPFIPSDDRDALRAVLTTAPGEIDLGILGPGDEAKRTFYLRNDGSGNPEWFAEVPAGWRLSEGQNVSGIIGRTPAPLRIHLVFMRETGTSKSRICSLSLRLEAEDQTAVFRREVPAGSLREEIRFNYDGGTASLVLLYRLVGLVPSPLLEVDPPRMDFGMTRPGEQITKSILLRNHGREPLTWRVGVAGSKGMPRTAPLPEGRYISFRNQVPGTGAYSLSGALQEGAELSGNWEDEAGYPSGQGEQNVLRYRFTGTGIRLYYWKSPEGAPFSLFFDEQMAALVDGYAERRERGEILIAEAQPEGPHLLTVTNGTGRLTLEGVRIFGKPTQKGPRGWISVFPDSGFTARESDYINVAIDTHRLAPGIYGDRLFFDTNGGEADVEVSLEVAAEATPQFLNVYRYLAGSDYLYTTNPQAEAQRLRSKGYRFLGIAFRLFAPGTPGTIDFFRWFNPAIGDHYYSYDARGDKPLPGYLFEGSIGNIATSRLTGTRELYRWFNPAKKLHFYTTDQTGEGLAKKGYRFDGIAGFVR